MQMGVQCLEFSLTPGRIQLFWNFTVFISNRIDNWNDTKLELFMEKLENAKYKGFAK